MESKIWHPNTQMTEWNNFPQIVSAKGVYLIDSDGKKLFDAVASMWCNVWGHSKPELIQAIIQQSKNLQHAPLFNLNHKPAIQLAQNLLHHLPGMDRIFYSDNGSSGMEIAIKMAIQYWSNINEPKSQIASLENGYHGDTFGAMSVGYVPQFFSQFKRQLFSVHRLPVPNRYRTPKRYSHSDHLQYCLEKAERLFSKNDKIAALVMESGTQVAGGVVIYPKNFQHNLMKICKKYNTLLVLDEVATGLGRLGSMIQYVNQNSRPDIVTFGKMLTGGYMTRAATASSKKIYDSFSGEYAENKHLFHGHTFTGNPIATSLALANLKLYKKHKLIQKIQKTSRVFTKHIDELLKLNLVGDVRHKGMLVGIELVTNKKTKSSPVPKMSINRIIFEQGRKNGLYLRTLGNIVMLVPPLIISEAQINMLVSKTISTIKSATPLLKS
ncbi:MAG: adenosylmethionine--8-amino-7-oxononanoate transaminase [Candidatus Nitrosoabyssus spongiisocia]|nr:MAG: adenosylmethionine--8-amino-7-oxononanoate transaminase [Nitrosopumilaceae archaeon AB1(1)]